MRRLWFVLLVGCGRIGFEPLSGAGGDGGPGDGRLIDAPMLRLEAGECPSGYGFFGTSCYRVQESPGLSWTAAEAACEADASGAHLVVPDDAVELATIQNDVLDATVADAWIGISDRIIEGTHRAVTGGIAFTAWDPGQPDGGTERCVDIGAANPMKDSACTDPNDFVCEYDGLISDPSAF